MSVRQAQREIDAAEFNEWLAYWRLEPFGETAADLRHGILTAVLANVNRDPKTRPQPFEPADFIPWIERTDGGPLLLDDADAQAEAMIAALFTGLKVTRTD